MQYIWFIVWLCKTKIRWKCIILLFGYRQLHCSCKTDNINKDIAEHVETRFDTSSLNKTNHSLKGKRNWINGKWIRWINHERIFRIKSKKHIAN